MVYDENNPFAKILRGELPCIKIAEDENCLVFMDIMPQADGHVLVIPKEAAETLVELSAEAAAACIVWVQRMVKIVPQAVDQVSATVFQLNGSEAGQTVPHVHFHIVPGSLLHAKVHAKDVEEIDKLNAIAEKIKALL